MTPLTNDSGAQWCICAALVCAVYKSHENTRYIHIKEIIALDTLISVIINCMVRNLLVNV